MSERQPGELWPTVPCKSCGAPMKWLTGQASGKKIPLDPIPVPGGNVRIEQSLLGPMAIYDREGPGPHYISHFASCPNAREHRKS